MAEQEGTVYSRKNPFPATLDENRKLTLEGSGKDTRHFEIGLAGSGLEYVVGDSLGVVPRNNPELVEELLKALKFSGEEIVPGNDKSPKPIREALLTDYVITELDKKFLKAVAEKDGAAGFLTDLIDPNAKTDLDRYTWGRDHLDMLKEFTAARFEPEEYAGILRKLQPRLYSIASSQAAVGESVHLTVAVVRYESFNRWREGVCSSYLAERVEGDEKPKVFVHTAKAFRMPEDPAAPMIMVGPGTGIAPFRAFLQERKIAGATGKNWLFFGEQRSKSDFFYQDEFEGFQKDGFLNRFDTAFSRDQDYKIYVQHRMLEAAEEFWKWLEEGAYFYVCGDAARMAKDVDDALHTIVQKAGGKSEEEACEYVDAMKKEKRYRRDVY